MVSRSERDERWPAHSWSRSDRPPAPNREPPGEIPRVSSFACGRPRNGPRRPAIAFAGESARWIGRPAGPAAAPGRDWAPGSRRPGAGPRARSGRPRPQVPGDWRPALGRRSRGPGSRRPAPGPRSRQSSPRGGNPDRPDPATGTGGRPAAELGDRRTRSRRPAPRFPGGPAAELGDRGARPAPGSRRTAPKLPNP